MNTNDKTDLLFTEPNGFNPDSHNLLVTDHDSVSSEYSELRAATFNLYYQDVEERVDGVVNFIKEYSPDTIGVQEATYQWITGLAKSELKENYNYIGEGRDGGTNGEYNAIFYRKDKLRVIEEGTYWLSPTPDVVSTIGGLCRIMTYGIFEELSTGKTFVHINTHLDHMSDKIRVDQIMYLKAIMEDHKLFDYHMILTGDLNSVYKGETYEAMVKLAVGFENTAEIAKEGDSPAKFTWDDQMVIDYIFISKTTPITVKNYRVYDEKALSDHCPVYIDYVY